MSQFSQIKGFLFVAPLAVQRLLVVPIVAVRLYFAILQQLGCEFTIVHLQSNEFNKTTRKKKKKIESSTQCPVLGIGIDAR